MVMFSDEATFYVFGHISRHNVRIWGCENPHVIHELIGCGPSLRKLNKKEPDGWKCSKWRKTRIVNKIFRGKLDGKRKID